jgi:hypothetical protein
MSRIRTTHGRLMSRAKNFAADRRGVVSFEIPIVFSLLMFSFLLPLADIAIAGFQYISAMQALRSFGQSILYSPPADLSDTSSWTTTAIAKADPQYPVSNFQLICGDSNVACSAANSVGVVPKYYSFATTITLSPLLLKSVLCTSSNSNNACAFTLSYTERFQ